MSSCAGVISDKAVSTSIDPCSIQQCGYNAVVDNEIGEARNSRTYQWLTQPDNQPLQQATLMMNNAPGPYLSSSMVLNDTDLSASTLLNLDLSMSELSGISQQLVSSPLQQDQSLVTSVISAAVSSCDNNQGPAPFAMETRDHQLVTSLVQSAAKATALLPVINGPLDTRASPWVESHSVPELTHLQSASMTLNDRDLSASTLLNLDLSMPELSGISQQIVSSPLQQDQSLVTSVISAAVSSCDNNQGPAPFAMETRDHHSISSLVQTAASTATASTLSIINGPLDANISPLVQSQCAPELNHLHSTKNVVLEVSDSPSKAKRGIPVWYEGKVSPAFAQHIFWPSPPKRKAPRVAHELFPASASTATWRELYKQKQLRISRKKQGSTHRLNSSLPTTRKKLRKTTLLGTISQETSETEKESCNKAKPARKMRSCSKRKMSNETAPKPDRISVTGDVECYVCCGLFSASKRGEKRWIECNNCGRWAHEVCIDIRPANSEIFCCDFCS